MTRPDNENVEFVNSYAFCSSSNKLVTFFS
jgi:hypothetical protein